MRDEQPSAVPDDWTATTIPGAFRRSLRRYPDERGMHAELWRSSWTAGLPVSVFRQVNLSRSRSGVVRGMHFHLRQADLWVVIEGAAFVALCDVTPILRGVGTHPVGETMHLSAGDALYVPPGVAHGYLALGDLAMVYLVTEEYTGADEWGFAWDDPLAAIGWPRRDPILSDRDLKSPSLLDGVQAALRASASPR